MGRRPNFKFGNVKGNVVISNNQSGGITTNGSNQNNDDKYKYLKWIGGFIAFCASVVGILTWFNIVPPGFITAPENRSQKIDTLHNPDLKKQNKLEKSKTMFNKKENSKKESTYQIGDVSGDLVISNNQTGGITAHTVVVNDGQDIPLKDNVQVELVTYQGRPAIKISCRQGTWENSFFAIPVGEIPLKKIKFHASSQVLTDVVEGTIDFSFNDGYATQTFDYKKWVSPKTNPKNPFYVSYDALPTSIVCGEWGNSDKQFTIRLK